jgi:hypothetical protein
VTKKIAFAAQTKTFVCAIFAGVRRTPALGQGSKQKNPPSFPCFRTETRKVFKFIGENHETRAKLREK